ncbi:hypothetical protein [uncultured Tenacibaculum sp.]|uniref:hypothetical protein n=1 Tax=Tenacibaculum halocynthiae TaxID=1254437 RepID=UPI0026236E8B|nr:hypothetical protein [uncultured Tenacibaculum sp.]
MRKTISFLLFFIVSYSFAQNEITYEKTLAEIKKSSKVLCTNLIIPNVEFSIGIFTTEWEVEDLTEEQCGDIKTNELRNRKILEILESKKLLEKFYVEMENNSFESIESNEKFEWNKTKLIINLNFSNDISELNQVYIPIMNKKEAKELIKSICPIFESDFCFKKLNRKL